MNILKLTPVAQVVLQIFGPMPIDHLHESEWDWEFGLLCGANRQFNEARASVEFTKGLDVSPYFVNYSVGYWGTYLN